MVVDEATVEARLRRLEVTIADMDRRLRAVEGSRTADEPRVAGETPPEASGLAAGS